MQNNQQFVVKRFLPIIAMAVAVAAIVVGVLLRRNVLDEDKRAESRATNATQASMDSKDAVGDLPSQRIVRRSRASMPANLSPEQRARHVSERREAMLKASRERNMALLKNVKAKFESEKIDPAWGPQAESRLESLVSPQQLALNNLAPDDMRVECKSTVCRIDSTFKSPGTAQDWTVVYMSNVGENLQRALVTTTMLPDGGVRIEIYGTNDVRSHRFQ